MLRGTVFNNQDVFSLRAGVAGEVREGAGDADAGGGDVPQRVHRLTMIRRVVRVRLLHGQSGRELAGVTTDLIAHTLPLRDGVVMSLQFVMGSVNLVSEVRET